MAVGDADDLAARLGVALRRPDVYDALVER